MWSGERACARRWPVFLIPLHLMCLSHNTEGLERWIAKKNVVGEKERNRRHYLLTIVLEEFSSCSLIWGKPPPHHQQNGWPLNGRGENTLLKVGMHKYNGSRLALAYGLLESTLHNKSWMVGEQLKFHLYLQLPLSHQWQHQILAGARNWLWTVTSTDRGRRLLTRLWCLTIWGGAKGVITSVEKLSSMKLVPGTKKVGDHCSAVSSPKNPHVTIQ